MLLRVTQGTHLASGNIGPEVCMCFKCVCIIIVDASFASFLNVLYCFIYIYIYIYIYLFILFYFYVYIYVLCCLYGPSCVLNKKWFNWLIVINSQTRLFILWNACFIIWLWSNSFVRSQQWVHSSGGGRAVRSCQSNWDADAKKGTPTNSVDGMQHSTHGGKHDTYG